MRDGRVVKGVRFRDHSDVGDVLALAARYRDEGADELVFYDITASPDGRVVERSWVESVARLLDIPFCVAGGIRTVADAERLLTAGAEKVSVNSPELRNPALVGELARRFGSQCIVVGIDSDADTGPDGRPRYRVHADTGDPARAHDTARDTLDWIREVQDRGAGEIVLNCMRSDGTRGGYDLLQLAAARAVARVPLIASGGAGRCEHFASVFIDCDVDGALAASVFHSGAIRLQDLKRYLAGRGLCMRPPPPPGAIS